MFDDPNELKDHLVTEVPDLSLAPRGETLARRTADHCVDGAIPYAFRIPVPHSASGCLKQRLSAHLREITADDLAVREVVKMGGRVDWVVLDRCNDVEASLLEAEAQSTRASEQVDGCRPPDTRRSRV